MGIEGANVQFELAPLSIAQISKYGPSQVEFPAYENGIRYSISAERLAAQHPKLGVLFNDIHKGNLHLVAGLDQAMLADIKDAHTLAEKSENYLEELKKIKGLKKGLEELIDQKGTKEHKEINNLLNEGLLP